MQIDRGRIGLFPLRAETDSDRNAAGNRRADDDRCAKGAARRVGRPYRFQPAVLRMVRRPDRAHLRDHRPAETRSPAKARLRRLSAGRRTATILDSIAIRSPKRTARWKRARAPEPTSMP